MRTGKKLVEGGRNTVLTWREERWNLSSYSFWSGEGCYVRLEEMHTGKQTTSTLTEGRKIICLENTHWHTLSSISVALTQKLKPHKAVARRAVLKAKIHLNSSSFTQWPQDIPIFISPNICKFYMKLLHTPSLWYPHTYGSVFRNKHDQKLLVLQSGLWTVTEQSSLFTPMHSFKRGIFQDPRLFCFLSWLSQGRQSRASFELNFSETIKIKFSIKLLKCIICC